VNVKNFSNILNLKKKKILGSTINICEVYDRNRSKIYDNTMAQKSFQQNREDISAAAYQEETQLTEIHKGDSSGTVWECNCGVQPQSRAKSQE
jgi:hypothetical protein